VGNLEEERQKKINSGKRRKFEEHCEMNLMESGKLKEVKKIGRKNANQCKFIYYKYT
jgi:hypothetical protein